MLIYLDNCSFNRPFDNQKQLRIHTETVAKLKIQEEIMNGYYRLAWSYILDYENNANPYFERKMTIANWKKRATIDTSETINILQIAKQLNKVKIKAKDALHIACAIEMQCDFFITTDLSLIKKCVNFEKIKVVNPLDFIVHENI
jgi:predicted nucleic acid-binding protein